MQGLLAKLLQVLIGVLAQAFVRVAKQRRQESQRTQAIRQAVQASAHQRATAKTLEHVRRAADAARKARRMGDAVIDDWLRMPAGG